MQRLFSLLFILFIIGCNDTKTTLPNIEASFRQTECFSNTIDNTGLICGYVDVPNDYFNKTATYSIPIIIKKTTSEKKLPPLVIVNGGPGDSVIAEYKYWLERLDYKNRDIIIYDQRGTGFSKPFLECNEIFNKYDELIYEKEKNINPYLESFNEDIFNQNFKDLYQNKYSECKQKLIDNNNSPNYFTTRNSAYDIESIRKTLDLNKVTLLGISYGTRLSLEYMELYPFNIDSVILDSIAPKEPEIYDMSITPVKNTFIQLFELCKNDILCNQAYPELKKEYLFISDYLNNNPYKTTVIDSSNKLKEIIISGETISDYIFLSLYNENLISQMPSFIHNVYNELIINKFDLIDYLIQIIGPPDDFGKYNSNIMTIAMVYNDIPLSINELLSNYEQLAEYKPISSKYIIYKSIEEFNLIEETQITKSTYDNNIRTLILSGELDPVTTVSYAQYIHNKLKNSTMVTFKNIAHNIERTICGKQTIQKFLDDTNNFTPPECVNDENKINFYIPENL
jgi:pimeloyl-ACP methyl ester carboxylesterase